MKANMFRNMGTAVVLLAGAAGGTLASAAEIEPNPTAATPCYWIGGRCVPACHGHAPTVAVPLSGVTYDAPPAPQVIIGTDGDDRIDADADDDVICGEGGIDVIWGGDGDDTIYGGDEADEIYGEPGDDTIWGGQGGDVIDGQEHEDTIFGQGDADGLRCGTGVDTVDGGGGAAVDFLLPNDGCENMNITRLP